MTTHLVRLIRPPNGGHQDACACAESVWCILQMEQPSITLSAMQCRGKSSEVPLSIASDAKLVQHSVQLGLHM